eukprot:7810040-Pyramimonas_sp.AAC.1
MKEAAREARDNNFRRRPHHPSTLLQFARSLARVVRRQDVKLAWELLESHPVSSDFIRVQGSAVELLHPEALLGPTDSSGRRRSVRVLSCKEERALLR